MNATARARSQFYGLLSELLSFPTEDLLLACQEGRILHTIREISAELPYQFPEAALSGLGDPGLEFIGLQSDYIRLFDLPGGGPSMPLYAGVFAASRRDSMEELLRFYRHFGLTVSADAHDLPDAIPTVLEFLHYLAFREAGLAPGEEEAALRSAQADVLQRHLLRWSAEAAKRIESKDPPPFYRSVVHLLHAFCAQETAALVAV
ncbi:MAG: molecular chaperone TorD family protein [Dehalococcoidia bacterium]|nr:molecular chaperone TorD family protein [Dehalococcoidia bacterium]